MEEVKECCGNCRFWDIKSREMADFANDMMDDIEVMLEENNRLKSFIVFPNRKQQDYTIPIHMADESFCQKAPPDARCGFAITKRGDWCGAFEER